MDCMCAILTAMENMGMPFNDPARISGLKSRVVFHLFIEYGIIGEAS